MHIKVVQHEDLTTFEKRVNELLEKGYEILSCGTRIMSDFGNPAEDYYAILQYREI